jgi:hypothetical protein
MTHILRESSASNSLSFLPLSEPITEPLIWLDIARDIFSILFVDSLLNLDSVAVISFVPIESESSSSTL